MIHYWFDTRERLLDALVEERLAPVFNYVWNQGDMERDAPVALIEGVMQRLFEVTGRAPWLYGGFDGFRSSAILSGR
jgi:hypothetical protein